VPRRLVRHLLSALPRRNSSPMNPSPYQLTVGNFGKMEQLVTVRRVRQHGCYWWSGDLPTDHAPLYAYRLGLARAVEAEALPLVEVDSAAVAVQDPEVGRCLADRRFE
jgi:hypothetical protein